MATIKSYTDIKQSKKLAEILPIESADMWYQYYNNPIDGGGHLVDYPVCEKPLCNRNECCPCWSLAALLEVLPKYIGDYGKCLYYDVGKYYCGYMEDGDFMFGIEETNADNPVDACVEMILKLREREML